MNCQSSCSVARRKRRAPSPRLRGEGRGEGAFLRFEPIERPDTLKRPLTRIVLAMLRIASAIRPLPARGERLGRRRINRSHPFLASDFELGDNPAHMTTFMESLY
jgi:hypothetical protein